MSNRFFNFKSIRFSAGIKPQLLKPASPCSANCGPTTASNGAPGLIYEFILLVHLQYPAALQVLAAQWAH
jgi:hypothetical protein